MLTLDLLTFSLKYCFIYAISFVSMVNVHADQITNSIQKIDSYKEIQSVFDQADAKTLFVFDVNGTLVFPKDAMLQPQNLKSDYVQNLEKPHFEQCPKETKECSFPYIASTLMLEGQSELIEPEIKDTIDALKKRNVKIIALTKIPTGKFGKIPNVEEWRYQSLKNLGIEFSQKMAGRLYFKSANANDPDQAVFYKGILVSSKQPKGEILGKFLDEIDFQPDKVIFIDNHEDHLRSVAEQMKKRGITYQGFYYLGALKKQIPLDKSIVGIQIDYVFKNNHWLNDKAAREKGGKS